MNMLMQLERTLAERLAADADRRARNRAWSIAMRRFAQLHPTWHEALFDEPFVRRMLASNAGGLDAATLAREWTRQFRYRDPRRTERDVRQVEPVAESLLTLLEEAQREVDPDRDRRIATSGLGRAEPSPC